MLIILNIQNKFIRFDETIKTEKMNKQKLNDYYKVIFIFLMLAGWAVAMYYFGKSISFQDQIK